MECCYSDTSIKVGKTLPLFKPIRSHSYYTYTKACILGGLNITTDIIQNADLDNVSTTGLYYFFDTAANKPDRISNGTLLVLRAREMDMRTIQIAFREGPFVIAVRMKWGGTFNSWHYLQIES